MKKVTKSREFDPIKENQPIESTYQKKPKHSLIKSFTQTANKNIKKSKTEEYAEKPAEDIKPAKGKFVKVKKSFEDFESIEKGGPKKFSTERPKATIPKREQAVAKTEEEKGCGAKYKKMVDYMKKKSIEENIDNNSIVKSLDNIASKSISEEQFLIFEKACMSLDPVALIQWIESMNDVEVVAIEINDVDSAKSEEIEPNPSDKFQQFLEEFTQKSIDAGITDSSIVKSLSNIDASDINNKEMAELEKAYTEQDISSLIEWINCKNTEKSKAPERKMDGTGPNGDGPKTGRGQGQCSDDELKDQNMETKKSINLPSINKAMNSTHGHGGDLVAPQLAGQKKKLVKVKKSLGSKSFFVQSDCQKA